MRFFISVQFTEPMINALEAFQSRLKASSVEGYFANAVICGFIGEAGKVGYARYHDLWS